MTNTITIGEGNPIVFVNEICKGIQNGFYVTTGIAGYPILGCPLMITLFEGDEPAIKSPLEAEIHTLVVEGWNILDFLLEVQSAVLQGFTLDTSRAVFGDFKSMVFTRKVGVKLDLNPTPKAAEPEAEEAPTKPARKPRAKKGDE